MPTLQTYNTMEAVERLAEFAHFDQRDRAGYPYINHPMRVMESVRQQGGAPYVQMAAVLHDVTEDTRFTPQMLLDLGVPEAAVDIVKLLDRDYSREIWEDLQAKHGDHESFPDADTFYYDQIRDKPEAKMVKLSDIGDNTLVWRLSYLKPEKQEYLQAKYLKARQLLGVI